MNEREIEQAAEAAVRKAFDKYRGELVRELRQLYHCNICGGEVDMSRATEPTADWGGRTKTLDIGDLK